MGVNGRVIGVIKHNAVLDQIADDDATTRDSCLPSQHQEPAGTVAEQIAAGSGCALGLVMKFTVRNKSFSMSHCERERGSSSYHPLVLSTSSWETAKVSVYNYAMTCL